MTAPEVICSIGLFLDTRFPLTDKMEEKIAWAVSPKNHCCYLSYQSCH